jgi:hypothetical protein
MKTTFFIVLVFLLGFFALEKSYNKKEIPSLNIETKTILSEKNEFECWENEIKNQHQEIICKIDSIQ